MIRLITFDSGEFTKSAQRLEASARYFGADDVAIYTPQHLDPFFQRNILHPLLPQSRGFGWWVWKPYIILGHALVACQPGDVLVYSDAGQEIVGPLKPVVEAMGDENMLLFSNGWQHSHWCKRETAAAINHNEIIIDNSKIATIKNDYLRHKQVQASFCLFRITDETKAFLQEWYAWSIMPGMIDNTPRGPQFPEFREHRHDQAILTCMQIKYGYKLHWFPSLTNMHQHQKEIYGATIDHHRKRDYDY
jgi:hypothetical protein